MNPKELRGASIGLLLAGVIGIGAFCLAMSSIDEPSRMPRPVCGSPAHPYTTKDNLAGCASVYLDLRTERDPLDLDFREGH